MPSKNTIETTSATGTRTVQAATDYATESPPSRRRNNRSDAARATPSTAEEVDALIFDCERLSVYSAIRRDFLDRWQRISAFLVVFSGTAAFAAISAELNMDWLALIPALFGLASLVFDFAGQARAHENVYRRFCVLRGEILADEDAQRNIAKWQRAIHEVYADDPAIYRALDAWAHNLACDGRGAAGYKLEIPWLHLMLKNIWPFWSAHYRVAKT